MDAAIIYQYSMYALVVAGIVWMVRSARKAQAAKDANLVACKQCGSPIATFQAVGQRMADAYVDVEAIRLTSWQAAWRISEGLDAREAVAHRLHLPTRQHVHEVHAPDSSYASGWLRRSSSSLR